MSFASCQEADNVNIKLMSKTQQLLIDNQYFKLLKFTPRHEKREVQIVFFFAWKISKIDSQVATLLIHLLRNKRQKYFPQKHFTVWNAWKMFSEEFQWLFYSPWRCYDICDIIYRICGPINPRNAFVSSQDLKKLEFQLLIMWHNAKHSTRSICLLFLWLFSWKCKFSVVFIVRLALEKCKLGLNWRN